MKVPALVLAAAMLLISNLPGLAQRPSDLPQLEWETDRYVYNTTDIPGLGSLSVRAELTDEDMIKAKATPIRSVCTDSKASPKLFNNSRTFRKLDEAFLASEANSAHLFQLAQNYPNLRALAIAQDAPLSKDELLQLKSFQKLELLSLECPVAEPTTVANYLPSSLKSLFISGTNIAESEPANWFNLPELTKLGIRDCFLSASFFRKLNCPNLQWIDVEVVRITGTTLGRVPRFPSLVRVDIRHTQMGTAILNEIEHLPDLCIREMTASNVYGTDTCWAEGLLEKR